LEIAPSTYYDAKSRSPSARALSDAALIPVLVALFVKNYSVYGRRKLTTAARRAGLDVGRDQVARLMRAAGIGGATRSRTRSTTRSDPTQTRAQRSPRGGLHRHPPGPQVGRRLHLLLHVVGNRLRGLRRGRVLPANRGLEGGADHGQRPCARRFEHGCWTRRGVDIDGVICHSDAGSQYTSIAYTDRLGEIGAAPSIGTVGDSFDDAMAETTIGLYKTELHRNPAALSANGGPWRGLDDLELATCAWVAWFNQERIHGELDDLTPAEVEAAYRDAPIDKAAA